MVEIKDMSYCRKFISFYIFIFLFLINRLDQAPDDCNDWANNCDPNGDGSICCHYDNYRKFVALKDTNPEFVPMISIGKIALYISSPRINIYLFISQNTLCVIYCLIIIQEDGMLVLKSFPRWLLIRQRDKSF